MTYDSPLGKLTLAAENGALCGLWLAGQKHFGRGVPGIVNGNAETIRRDITQKDEIVFQKAFDWLTDYFAGGQPPIIDLPLRPSGTDFQKNVWRILCEIPYGGLRTYGEIALQIGCKSARAVGGAVGRNPVSIIIPCHRVVGAKGKLTGYAGGIGAKERLLILEGLTAV
jgi:methylated-DNA-[protein]-cysteine S-methyltransferase